MTFRKGFLFVSSVVLLAGFSAIPALAARNHRAPTSGHSHSKHRKNSSGPAMPVASKSHKMHGQQAIDSERVTAIQTALVREHYLTSEPSGKWDAETQAAMLKFQADQGWQTRLTPDSRALIKLGLGPNHSSAINAGTGVSFTDVSTPSAAIQPQTQGFVAASGVSH